MIRALAVVTVLAATAHTASAGIYGSLGIGNTGATSTNDSLGADSRSGRIAAGMRFKYLSAEVGYMGYGRGVVNDTTHFDGKELYGAGLLHWPLGNGFEVFGRLGAQHTSIDNTRNTYSGNGYLYGAGFEYAVKLTFLARASVWVDYNRNDTSVAVDGGTSKPFDLGVSMWTLGVSAGF